MSRIKKRYEICIRFFFFFYWNSSDGRHNLGHTVKNRMQP